MNNLSIQDMEIIKTDAEGNTLTPLMGLIYVNVEKKSSFEGDRFFEQKENEHRILDSILDGNMWQKYMYTLPIPAREIDLVDGLAKIRDILNNWEIKEKRLW